MNHELSESGVVEERGPFERTRSVRRARAGRARSLLALVLLLALVAVPGRADEEVQEEAAEVAVVDLELDDATLAALASEAVEAVAAHTGVSLEGLTVRVAERAELREVLLAELQPQFDAMFEDPLVRAANLRQSVSVFSRALYAKYAPAKDEVLVIERNFNEMARTLRQPRMTSHGVLRSVLVHEAVHAVDERTHDFDATLSSLQTRDANTAFSAVLEGHAQYVSRQVTEKHGWSEDFAFFTDMIDEAPDTGEAALDYMIDVQAASSAAAYYDGESFIAYLAEHGGPDAIARAFREPPAETILIEEPGWYLDPASRPALVHDLVPVLAAFADARDTEGEWNREFVALTRAQLDAAFSILPDEVADPVLDEVRQSHLVVQAAKDAPAGSVMVVGGLFETTTADAARQLLELEEQLMRKKDEVMNNGLVKIKDPLYREETRGPITGTYSSKTVQAGPQTLFTQTIVLRRDLVVLELIFVGDRWTEDEAFDMAIGLVQAAHESRREVEEHTDDDTEGDEEQADEAGGDDSK